MAGKGFPRPLRLSTLIILLLALFATKPTIASREADALLNFKASLSSNGGEAALRTWTAGSNPCNENHSDWDGVLCYSGNVWGLQLENKGLSGQLDISTLAGLPSLRAISFMNNDFVGPMPEIQKLRALKALYLSNNQFTGEIPDGIFNETRSLKKLYISNNLFTGKIPSSLTELPKLLVMRLDDNEFEGEIPDFRQPSLRLLNVSYNKLEGKIPDAISMMDRSLFEGNGNLCGLPLKAQCPSSPAEKKSTVMLIAIIVLCIIVVLLLLCFTCLYCNRRQSDESRIGHHASFSASRHLDALEADRLEQGSIHHSNGGGSVSSSGGRKSAKEAERLTFIMEDRGRFELQDLLRASAEVLGSGNFGSSYKAVLPNGPAVVVKRYKEMNKVGREDFQEHMRRLGRLSHSNVLPLVAYYYRKEEKLIITNYILNGSLAHMLHGNRGSGLPPLEWPTRLKIIKGVARGLAYLYEELPMLTLPHGHLKSSNVLIDDNYDALLTDYALVPVVNQSHASQVMVAFKCPEVSQTGRPSKKSDVWSLGILILEVLTGKFPANYLQKGKGDVDLVGWVNSIVKEEWTSEVFDSEMKGTKNEERQMMKLLKIGLACCEVDVNKRWEMKEALEKIEGLKERERESDDSSASMSEVDLYPSNDSSSFPAEK